MSWTVGWVSASRGGVLPDIKPNDPTPLHRVEKSGFYLAAGGIPETCLRGSLNELDQGESGWVVLGLGIERLDTTCRFLSKADWRRRLASETPDLNDLDGHFVIIRWKPGETTFFNDQLGLRTLFFASVKGGWLFSTRLDLLGGVKVDPARFGAQWIAFNQLTQEAPVQKVERLGAGGVATIQRRELTLQNRPWSPGEPDSNPVSFEETARAFASPVLEDGRSISVGLSGGLDSRTLLALTNPERDDLSLHVFGHPEDPDVRISKRIAHREGIRQTHFHEPLPDAESCIELAREFVIQKNALAPASFAMKMRYYPQLHARGALMLDGGFGGIARRQVLNRLLLRGRSGLRAGKPREIRPHLEIHRASIFNASALEAMRRGLDDQVEAVWEEMPSPEEIGFGNFADLLTIRTRLPNVYGYGQARLDGLVLNYMPFAQPSFLRSVLQAPLRKRRGGKAFRQIVRQGAPTLGRYPLVKSGTTVPFALSTFWAMGWATLKSRFGRPFADPTPAAFLDRVGSFVRDLAHSADVREYPLYDSRRIVQIVEGYYQGDASLAGEVDWWLAFELWRRAIGTKASM